LQIEQSHSSKKSVKDPKIKGVKTLREIARELAKALVLMMSRNKK